MSFGLGMQIFGLTIAIAAILALIVISAFEKMTKIYFTSKLAYMAMLQKELPDSIREKLEAVAKRYADDKDL